MNAPFDVSALWSRFEQTMIAPRGDEDRLHGSDLLACDRATWLRLQGEPTLPFDGDSIAQFMMGHAVEAYVTGALDHLAAEGYTITRGREVEYRGSVGHVDVDLELWPYGGDVSEAVAVLDVRTTKAKEPEPKDAHVLKSAFYAVALGAPHFAEWVFCLGFGKIAKSACFWFETEKYRARVEEAIDRLEAVAGGELPEAEPPTGMEWLCGKPGSGTSYCRANCWRNARLVQEEVPF